MAQAKFILGKIQSFSLGSSPRDFGSEVGRFGNTLTYNVSCYKVDISNTDGVSTDLITDLTAIRNQQDYLTLDIKGNLIKLAKLIDFSFEEGSFNKYGLVNLVFEKYSAAEENQIPDGGIYACFNNAIAEGAADYQTYFEEFSENFDFSEGKDSTSYTYTLNIKLRAQAGEVAFATNTSATPPYGSIGGTPIQLAKQFAEKIFNCESRPNLNSILFGADLHDLYDSTEYKRTYGETYDLINNNCSFSETFDTSNIDGDEATIITQEAVRNLEGLVTLTERGHVEGIGGAKAHDQYLEASGRADTEIKTDGPARLETFYVTRISGDGDLDLARNCDGTPKASATHVTRNSFAATVDYTITITTDMAKQCGCSGSYIVTDNEGEDGINKTIQRQINIEGEGIEISGLNGGPEIVYPKFNVARAVLLKPGTALASCVPADKSVYDYYTNTTDGGCAPDEYSDWPISENWTYNKKAGTISVAVEYSDNQIYRYNGRGRGGEPEEEQWMKKYEITTQENGPASFYNTFPFLNSEITMKKMGATYSA